MKIIPGLESLKFIFLDQKLLINHSKYQHVHFPIDIIDKYIYTYMYTLRTVAYLQGDMRDRSPFSLLFVTYLLYCDDDGK